MSYVWVDNGGGETQNKCWTWCIRNVVFCAFIVISAGKCAFCHERYIAWYAHQLMVAAEET